MIKHQSDCYRNIRGVKFQNYCDLIMSKSENNKAIAEAKSKFNRVRIVRHHSGEYKQLFVANK